MQTFLNALKTAITAVSNFSTLFPGGYWRDRAAEGTAMPFLVSTVVAAPLTVGYPGAEFSEPTVRLCAYGIGHDALLAAMDTLVAALDGATLTISGGTQLNNLRKTAPVPQLTGGTDGQGREIWRVDVVYTFAL